MTGAGLGRPQMAAQRGVVGSLKQGLGRELGQSPPWDCWKLQQLFSHVCAHPGPVPSLELGKRLCGREGRRGEERREEEAWEQDL